MNAHDQLHVVLGASGGAGGALVRELAGRGQRVRAVSRKPAADLPEGVEPLAADASNPAQTRTACQGATVVYHCAQPPYERWAAEFPPLTQSIADAAANAGARLVYADNLYTYGPVQRPLTEDLPARATTKKGRARTLMAQRLLAAHRAGTLQVAIARSSDYYGPGGANSFVGDILFGAAATGKRARWLGRLDVPHSLNYLPDVARALATLGARPEALGEVWHLPAAEPLTGRAFVELIAAALGRPVKVAATSRLALRIAGVFDPGARESIEMLYQWEHPFVLDASKFQRAFGPLEPTPHPRAVATTVAWFRERAGRTRR
ncbi:MAG TPA: NAD-dependent epimerase/dehydratase family protein [Actinomycetes bacterium]|jgi:nucleoside-diphosphate-sugar epimerase|nr:NAD-dependent epimerase/dehydratase family protein [Actinomycetes bacterium]